MTTETEQFFDRAGGSAFPIVAEGGDQSGLHAELHPGMTLRDYFAAKAITGFVGVGDEIVNARTAAFAYKMADAMLRARIG